MKVLYFTKYAQKGASSRMRSFQYFPFFEAQNIHVTVSPFFNDDYLDNLYGGKKNFFTIVRAYFKRLFAVFTVFNYDSVVIEYELFPYFPAWFEKMYRIFGVRYIVDYDDAIFHNYNLHPNLLLRKLFGNKIAKVMQYSNTVVAGNKYLADYARKSGAHHTVIIPTVIDLANYRAKDSYKTEKFTVGWIGSPSTYHYVEKIKEELITFATKNNAEIIVIGVYPTERIELPFRFIPWSSKTEKEWLCTFDVGLMPLVDTPWSRGKCAFKLIQYMASGVPVIASPVGMNTEVVTIENGYLAAESQDWLHFLQVYFENEKMREEHGIKGRSIIENGYTLQGTSKKWLNLLISINDI